MTDAIIAQVVERVAAIVEDRIRYEFNLVRGVDKELLDLSDKLKTITNVLDDAEKRGVKEQSVKSWLKKLENTAYEMDDILDEWNYALLKHEIEASAKPKQKIGCSFIPSPCSCFKKVYVGVRRETGKKIEDVKVKLAKILKEKDDFKFEHTSQPAIDVIRVQSTSSIDLKKVHGLDIQRKKIEIMSKLKLDAANTQILSIVGTGGLGKTTLAQLIFNDPQFDKDWLKIWVCVSDPFIVPEVAKNIVNSVGKVTIPADNDQSELALQKLKASVLGKKFILVLDDVWTEDTEKWEPLKINLEYGAPGSKILVTTRNERIARMMGTLDGDIYHPKELSPEECWSLFRDTSLAGKSEEECGKYENVGMKIATKCKGLPLAAVVLGRLLRFKDLEGWKHVERSEIWELDNEEVKLFPHLVLSYNELSPALKRCFSYCAVYPKDHQIHAETLIEEWMAQGYLGSISGISEVELKGREYLRNLAMRSLFQDIELSKSGEQVEWCKMHDIIHDFALFLRKNDEKERSCQACEPSLASHVQKYRSLYWEYRSSFDEKEKCFCDCMKSLRVLKIEMNFPPMGMETLIHLRWLDVFRPPLSKGSLEIVCRLYFLQTLLLSRCRLTEVPQEIGNLVQLRRLDLSWNEELRELPESMGRLVELQTLFIVGCSLKEICRGIGDLVQLRELNLSKNRELEELPESIYNLVELQKFSLAECSLKEIHKEIGNLVKLRHLNLTWNDRLKGLPESICSLVELQILNIEDTDINFLPEALGELSNLHTLRLRVFKVGNQCNKLGFLKILYRFLPKSLLLEIHFRSMSEMVELVEDARQTQSKILLQNLENLDIRFVGWMDEEEQSLSSSLWMEIVEAVVPHHTLKKLEIKEYKGSRLPHLMSSPLNFIKEIRLNNAREVSSLPAIGKLPYLESLDIWGVGQLKLLGREFFGIESSSDNAVVAFPKLNQLSFRYSSEWEEWEDITEEEEESATISIMPCLTQLSITYCTGLKKLPHRLLH